MIELTEEPYDGEVAAGFIAALLADLNERYIDDTVDWTADDVAASDAVYLGEVTPDQVRRPRGVFLVAWLDGEPAGCGALKPAGDAPGVAEIKRMYTVTTARRQGVSKVVLRRLEEVASELGYRSLRLETGTQQPEAIALYEATGWRRIDPFGTYRESPWSVCMAKDVAAP